MSLRTGITTGTCAAAAAKAAAMVLCGQQAPQSLPLVLPQGQEIQVPILYAHLATDPDVAVAAVRKDGGDDPDVTHGLEILVRVSLAADGDVTFRAGEGVGIVTKPGLQVPPGEPAINPVPRRMIHDAVRQITSRPVCIEVAIPGGRGVAARTYNPRLGIEGGLSVLGTTGIVRPYCIKALRNALKCSLDVAAACGVSSPVLVPGNIGAKAARRHFRLRDEQLIEVGNEWGYMADCLGSCPFAAVMVLGHPGKLAKLAGGQWDTHSSRSDSAVGVVSALYEAVLRKPAPWVPTVEGLFAALTEPGKTQLADRLAQSIREAVAERIHQAMPVAAVLVSMAGECLGTAGDLALWR